MRICMASRISVAMREHNFNIHTWWQDTAVTNFITKTKLRGRSPQANYTDRATAVCRRS
jgi:hypothetical protein